MHAGLYDDNPRAKELVWMMLANRAARGLASLYVQSNEFTLEQAGNFHAAWTPRGWAVAGDSLTGFEQLLYLRQPGYGASYVTGKILFDRLMAEYSRQQEIAGKPFVMRDFIFLSSQRTCGPRFERGPHVLWGGDLQLYLVATSKVASGGVALPSSRFGLGWVINSVWVELPSVQICDR
jgi:hypothetical protein